MKQYLRTSLAVARKDFLLELRSKQALPLSVTLSLLIIMVFAFSFGGGAETRGALWIAFIFAGTIGVMQSVSVEADNSALDGLFLTPVPKSAIYVGKVVSSAVFVTIIGFVTLGAIAFFLHSVPELSELPLILSVLVLSSVGFAAVAVVVSVIAMMARISEILLPVLLVPLLVPLLLAGVELTQSGGLVWLQVLGSYDGLMFTAGLLVFDELAT